MLTITDTGTYLEITQAIAGLSAVREYTFEYSQVSTVTIDNHFLLKTTSEDFSEHFDNITLVGITLGDSSAAGLAAYISALSLNPASEDINKTILSLANPLGVYYNMASAHSNATYTVTGSILGGFAKVLINTGVEPTVTGATKIAGSTFTVSTNMYLVVNYNGNRAEYSFLEIEGSTDGGGPPPP
jgi:hypothetical protein